MRIFYNFEMKQIYIFSCLIIFEKIQKKNENKNKFSYENHYGNFPYFQWHNGFKGQNFVIQGLDDHFISLGGFQRTREWLIQRILNYPFVNPNFINQTA